MKRLRQWLLDLFRRGGGFGLWRFWHRYRVIILTIHGVMHKDDQSLWEPLRPQLSPQQLERYLQTLSKHYQFITLQEAVEMLTGQEPIRPYCLVFTFDDGYRNTLTHALPVLRRFGAPATLFITTGHVEHRRPFWFDRLDYAIQQAPQRARELQAVGLSLGAESDGRNGLREFYKQLRDRSKHQQRHDSEMRREMSTIAATLEAESGQGLAKIFEEDNWSAVLNWSEIQRAARAVDVSFGSHTVDHVRLGLVDEQFAKAQLQDSKKAIEKHTGRPCLHLCYPNGSHDERSRELARKYGYECAVTTRAGTNRVGGDIMALRRINLPIEAHSTELLARVSGLSQFLYRLKSFVTIKF